MLEVVCIAAANNYNFRLAPHFPNYFRCSIQKYRNTFFVANSSYIIDYFFIVCRKLAAEVHRVKFLPARLFIRSNSVVNHLYFVPRSREYPFGFPPHIIAANNYPPSVVSEVVFFGVNVALPLIVDAVEAPVFGGVDGGN